MPIIDLPKGNKELIEKLTEINSNNQENHIKQMVVFEEILKQLKVLNTYMAVMNNTVIRED